MSQPTFLPRVETSTPKFTKDEKSQIAEAVTDYVAQVQRMRNLENLRAVILRAADDYAAGDLSLANAVGLCSCPPSGTERARIKAQLRAGCKRAIRAICESVNPLVIRAHEHRHTELLDRCRLLETQERATSASVGIVDDDFQPSEILRSLRHVCETQGRHHRLRQASHGMADELKMLADLVNVKWNLPTEAEPLEGSEPHEVPSDLADLDEATEADLDDDTQVFEGDLDDDISELLKIEYADEPLHDGE